MTELSKDVVAELDVLIGKATDEDLCDGGRYFDGSCSDLTQCRHSEIGEYQNAADGELIEWLWNNRHKVAALQSQCDRYREALEQAGRDLLACWHLYNTPGALDAANDARTALSDNTTSEG